MSVSSTLRLFLPFLLTLPLGAQEDRRDLDRPGEHHKHLTVDTMDQWIFEAAEEEIIRADVSSTSFDPVISLARLSDGERTAAVVVPETDDPGSRSHMLARLQRGGRFAIRVHGPGKRGGGNYRLYVERLQSTPLGRGVEAIAGVLDEDGYAHVRFDARAGDTVAPFGDGFVELIDPSGRALDGWAGCYDLRRDGEHYVRVRVRAGARYRVGVERSRRRPLAAPAQVEDILPAHGLDEWVLPGKPGEFRTLEVEGDQLEVRVVPRHPDRGEGLDARPALQWLPAHSKGLVRRMSFVFGWEEEYRIQVRSLARAAKPYRLEFGDSSRELVAGRPVTGGLAVGGSHFYRFDTTPGQVLRLEVESARFDPVLRLSTGLGRSLGSNDDGGAGLDCRHGWMVERGGEVLAQVASFGDGGGGEYRLRLTEVPVPELELGGSGAGELGAEEAAYWHLEGVEGQLLYLATESSAVDTGLLLHDPAGIQVASDRASGADRGALLGLRLPRTGRYTLTVQGRSGQGPYSVRAWSPPATP